MDAGTTTGGISERDGGVKPNRKRRLILIATLVMIVLIGGGWWLIRPRIDPRFVGHWTWHKVKGSYPENIKHPSRAISKLTLNANGTGMSQGLFPKVTSEWPIRWWNDALGRLLIRSYESPVAEIGHFVENVQARATGGSVIGRTSEWTIREASADRFVVDSETHSSLYFMLKRVPQRVSPAATARKD
jgi:hypothetical protein